jgi:hypothetical protein
VARAQSVNQDFQPFTEDDYEWLAAAFAKQGYKLVEGDESEEDQQPAEADSSEE